jgi:hypothetical protein
MTNLSTNANSVGTMSSNELTKGMLSLMSYDGVENAMWMNRAAAMMTPVISALCWARDEGLIDLTVEVINEHVSLSKIVELANGEKYPNMPDDIKRSLKSYLHSLPGYQPEMGAKQGYGTLEQHFFVQATLGKIPVNA